MVFEKTKAPSFYEDFLNWTTEQTQWSEERDYNTVEGTSPQLTAWFMDMKNTFPPLNGPYVLSDEEAFASKDAESHLTDYSIGSSIIYAAFAWSVADEASELAAELAKKHGVGFFNHQTAYVYCDGMVQCKMRTESGEEKAVTWEQIERELFSLDHPERGTSNREGAFVTLWFEQNGADDEFVQCMPNYPKQQGLLKKLFGLTKNSASGVFTYAVEVGTGEKIYTKQVDNKEQVAEILHRYYLDRKLPATADGKIPE